MFTESPLKDQFIIVVGFNHFGKAEITIVAEVGLIKSSALVFTNPVKNWAILSKLFSRNCLDKIEGEKEVIKNNQK